ncbi:MAG: c-type cytochrome [Halofilum sp. (in: g-proteobacteria)]
MQRISLFFATATLILSTLNAAHAAGDPDAGREKSENCASCHGDKGNTQDSQYPKLAGQHPSYLYETMKGYKSGDRENSVMKSQVSDLSDQDMRDLAAYYASQESSLYTLPLKQ